uniref:Putative ras-like protein n=1 Tax=Rhizophora mucronata TaxID=61149 RepID=A0A2P2JVC1_RHIMU
MKQTQTIQWQNQCTKFGKASIWVEKKAVMYRQNLDIGQPKASINHKDHLKINYHNTSFHIPAQPNLMQFASLVLTE